MRLFEGGLRRRAGWIAGLTAMVGLLAVVPAAASTVPAAGTPEFAKRFAGSAGLADVANAIAVSPDGSRMFVTGRTGIVDSDILGTVSDYATVAYDTTTGKRLWARRYDGPANGDDVALAVAVAGDGSRVFVTGQSADASGGEDYATVAYDVAGGDQLWVRRYNGPAGGDDFAAGIVASADGSRVYVTGTSDGSSFRAFATLAYDASTGALVWKSRTTNSLDRQAVGIAIAPNGSRVYVTGTTHADTTGAYETDAYDTATGARLWTAHLDGPSQDVPSAIAVSRDGTRVVVTGYNILPGTGFDIVTAAYRASSGEQMWSSSYNRSSGPADEDVPRALAVAHGRVYVDGYSLGAGNFPDYTTLAYSLTGGQQRWVRHFDDAAHGSDTAAAIAVSPDSATVYVTGEAFSRSASFDSATIAYAAGDGHRQWMRRYDGGADATDSATGLALLPEGSQLFVTGRSTASGANDYDFATVAYAG